MLVLLIFESLPRWLNNKLLPYRLASPAHAYSFSALVFYVDPASTSEVELGTELYPYRRLYAPFKEIFNYAHDTSEDDAVISLRRGANSYILQSDEPLIVVGINSLTLQYNLLV